jgi:hypothetical protein
MLTLAEAVEVGHEAALQHAVPVDVLVDVPLHVQRFVGR